MENCWIQTYSGKKINPLAPKADDICFDDIAHALSNICRFNGHCNRFYSVAQHSVYVSVHASPENALWGLLHDASEAYICDLVRPVKNCNQMDGYSLIEDTLMFHIAKTFDLCWPMPEEIKELDRKFLFAEARDLGLLSRDWDIDIEPAKTKINPQDPESAKQCFYDWYYVLMNRGE